MRYEITAQRWDIPEHTILEFIADSDDKARELFKKYKNNKKYSWDDLKLVRFTEEIIEMWSSDKQR